MMRNKKSLLLLALLFLFPVIAFAIAQDFVLDIKIDKQIYSAGENVTFTVLLFENATPINDQVSISISDISGETKITSTVFSNKDNLFYIEKDYISGYWQIFATYKDKTVKRFFSIGEREEASFKIEDDKLIITNTGNVQYTKTVQILIGEKIITQKQNIKISGFKEIRLIAPSGSYGVQVTDGKETLTKDVQLTGTGNVIGALDEELVKKRPLLGTVRESENDSFFVKNFTPAFVFIGAVFALLILLYIEKVMRKKRKSSMSHSLKAIV